MPDSEPVTKQDLAQAVAEIVGKFDARIERLETSLLSELHDYAAAGQRRIRDVEIQTKASHERVQIQVERLNELERRLQQIERRLDLGPAA